MKNTLGFISAVVVVLSATCGMCDGGYQMSRHSINSGGGPTLDATHVLNCSVGQSVAGFVGNTRSLTWIGFWAGDVLEPMHVSSLGAAKTHAGGTFLSVAGKVATTCSSDFPGFYYIEEPTRSSGIRVAAPAGSLPTVGLGDVVDVIGCTSVNSDGEVQIIGPIASISGTGDPLRPLSMNNGVVSGGESGLQKAVWGWQLVSGSSGFERRWQEDFGLNNVGLRITTYGKVVSADPASRVFVIGDGAGVTAKCVVREGVIVRTDWEHVAVTGIASCEKVGDELRRVVLVRAQEDIVPY